MRNGMATDDDGGTYGTRSAFVLLLQSKLGKSPWTREFF